MRRNLNKIGYGIDLSSIVWKKDIEQLLYSKFGSYLRLKYDNYVHEINYERHQQNRMPLSHNQTLHYFITNYNNNYGYIGIFGILCDIINEDKFPHSTAIAQMQDKIIYIQNENITTSSKYKLLFTDGQIKNILSEYVKPLTDSEITYVNVKKELCA